MKKRILSAVLAVCMLLSLSLSVFAATATPTVDKTTVKAGEKVSVTISMNEAISRVNTIAYKLRYDSSVFANPEEEDCTTADGQPEVAMSTARTDAKGTYVNLSTLDTKSNGATINAGVLCTVVFTAKKDVSAEATAKFVTEFENGIYSDFSSITGQEGGSVSVTVQPAATSYSVAVSADPTTVNVGADTQVTLTVSGGDSEGKYSAYQFELSYDAEKLTYKAIDPASATVKPGENGKLTVIGVGADRTEPVILTFTGKAAGDANVTLTTAKIDLGDNANVQDAPEATITEGKDTATIKVTSTHSVTFEGNDPKILDGVSTVEDGENYTFSKTDKDPKHYTYTVTATMGGADAAVTDNDDGTYTIKNVTGDLVITGSRTAKTYKVTATDTEHVALIADPSATYGRDYKFDTFMTDDSYTHTVEVTIGGVSYTPTVEYNSDMGMYTYTIKGTDIIGDIVIVAHEEKQVPENTTINFTGSGSGDVVGGTTQTAKTGEAFTFTVTKAESYKYTVTAKQGDNTITVTDNGNGTYTIGADDVNGTDITVTVTKDAVRTVEVNEYVKLDGKSMFLVTVSGPVSEGKVLTYDGNAMFWSEKYNAYAYLVISDKQLSAVKEAASALIGEKTADKTTIDYDGDVNGTGRIDVNDAQLVWNMYNAKYSSFGATTMEMFLRADMNGSRTLNVDDAAAIIDKI